MAYRTPPKRPIRRTGGVNPPVKMPMRTGGNTPATKVTVRKTGGPGQRTQVTATRMKQGGRADMVMSTLGNPRKKNRHTP